MKPRPYISTVMSALKLFSPTVELPSVQDFSSKSSRRKTGKKYPFSSKRQNERYARQIAAGQLQMERV